VARLTREEGLLKVQSIPPERVLLLKQGQGLRSGYRNDPGSSVAKSMSALPIILKQNSVSVGLFTLLRERELGLERYRGPTVGLRSLRLLHHGGLFGTLGRSAQLCAREYVKLFGDALKPTVPN
jgi:hypothetical protein